MFLRNHDVSAGRGPNGQHLQNAHAGDVLQIPRLHGPRPVSSLRGHHFCFLQGDDRCSATLFGRDLGSDWRRGSSPGSTEGSKIAWSCRPSALTRRSSTVAVNLKKGKDATGHVSLRSAIQAADVKGGSHKILLPAGTFTLTIAGAGEDAADRRPRYQANVTIQGGNSGSTVIDGNNLDRVFQVLGGKVSLSEVTVQHGRATVRVVESSIAAARWGSLRWPSEQCRRGDERNVRHRRDRGQFGGAGGPAPPGRTAGEGGSSTRPGRFASRGQHDCVEPGDRRRWW